MGADPGEWLSISFSLPSGARFGEVIAALAAGTYKVGVRIQGFASGGSESAIAGSHRVSGPSAPALINHPNHSGLDTGQESDSLSLGFLLFRARQAHHADAVLCQEPDGSRMH
jgi:hypothetical protein